MRARFLWLGRTGSVAATLILGATGIVFFIALWTLVSARLNNAVLLPSPLAVIESYRQLVADGSLLTDVHASIVRVFAGFAIASIIAVPLALVLAHSRILRGIVMPLIALLRPIPPIAWIPLAILWMGLGDPPSYFITAVAAFFPIFLNAFVGGTSLQHEHVNAARSLGASTPSLLVTVMLPSALPMIVTGLRIGLGQAWMAVVTAELIAAQSGLGYMIQISRLDLETARVLVGMTVIGLLGAVMIGTLGVVERRLIVPWNYQR
ncbi:ABC transporter permease [Hyphomicrobium sp. MC1]|uniref:ABC transporter permease n=1 Tax=Hyphomicrobium sp. (strain MC1) TaxID=717785 RepID=UPI000213EB5F|nr:ABC transporter permease [Hyphomicrobium sp. MC1]CCB66602.1 ABC-type nitrate/sulfonate/bicarbonate transport system, permease component [Hyphomicrobium sp. MC1]